MLKTYLKNLVETAEKGDATEESYYSSLAEFIEQYTKASGKTAISVTTEVVPKNWTVQ